MGILRSPAIFLIVGILTWPTVYGLDVVPPANTVIQFLSSNGILQNCDPNDGSAASKKFRAGLGAFETCVYHVSSDLPWTYANYTALIADVPEKCNRAGPLKTCVNDLAKLLFDCLDEEGNEMLKNIQNTISSVLKYLCDEDGKRGKTFIMKPACWDHHNDSGKPTLRTCYADFLEKDILQRLQSWMNGTLAIDAEKCEYFDKFDLCIVEVIEDCTYPKTADTVKSIRQILIEESGCGKFIKSRASPSISAVHSLLLIAAIAMFFRLR